MITNLTFCLTPIKNVQKKKIIENVHLVFSHKRVAIPAIINQFDEIIMMPRP